MKNSVYSIMDVKAAVFGRPFVQLNNAVAMRTFSDLAKDAQSEISRHPEDFKLFRLGEFDDNSGVLSPVAQPEFLASGSDFDVK